jgi:molybdopterin molybdotransferase
MPGREWEDPETMLGVDAALETILAAFAPLPPVSVPLLSALGLVVAHDIVSTTVVPPFRNSAMDGYAVRAADTRDAPVTLRVIEEVAAGSVPRQTVGVGQAVRIMTGAPLPDGADTVVRFEETDELARAAGDRAEVTLHRCMATHENVREPGEDIQAGEIVIRRGTRLRPAEIGLLASLNHAEVAVHRRPRVTILSTGDEVVDLGPELEPGQIRNSNSYIIAALVQREGGEPLLLGVARDTTADLRERLGTAGEPDLFVTSGGVSVGDYDMVKDVLRAEGSVDLWQVRMKPGKPLAFGRLAGKPLLGLPGNPVAALVAFEQFGVPALRTMLGRPDIHLPVVNATLSDRLDNRGRRRHFVRGVVERTANGYRVRSTGNQGSAVLTAVARANCFIVVHESREVVEAGESINVQLFDHLAI